MFTPRTTDIIKNDLLNIVVSTDVDRIVKWIVCHNFIFLYGSEGMKTELIIAHQDNKPDARQGIFIDVTSLFGNL